MTCMRLLEKIIKEIIIIIASTNTSSNPLTIPIIISGKCTWELNFQDTGKRKLQNENRKIQPWWVLPSTLSQQ